MFEYLLLACLVSLTFCLLIIPIRDLTVYLRKNSISLLNDLFLTTLPFTFVAVVSLFLTIYYADKVL